MLISDFELKERNTAAKGEKPRMEVWQSAAGGNTIAIGYKDGKKYQVKLHAAEPKWYYADKAIADKQRELAAAKDKDKPRITSELNSLKKNKEKYDRNDAIADGYLTIKSNLIRELNAIGDPLIVVPIGIWKQEIDFKGNAVFCAEATPWAEHAYMGGEFGEDDPLVFTRDPKTEQQYAMVASLADRLNKLHGHGIIHGDLKIGNTLMVLHNGKFEGALIDFDAAILLSDLRSQKFEMGSWNKAIGGTYFSPEMYELYQIIDARDEQGFKDFDFNTITTKSDIFGLGVTIYEYFFGRADMGKFMPFINADGETFVDRDYCVAIANGFKLALPNTVNDFLYAVINWMLDPLPQNRPTAKQVADAFRNGTPEAVPARYRRGYVESPEVAARKAQLADLQNKFAAVYADISQKIELIETTTDRTDDNLLGLYEVLCEYASGVIGKLKGLINNANNDFEVTAEQLTKNGEYLEKARNTVDTMLEQYPELCMKFDNIQDGMSLYILTTENSDADKCLFAIDNYEDELFDLSRKLLDKHISTDDTAANNMKWAFGFIEATSKSLNNLYAKALEEYSQCIAALHKVVETDVSMINDYFSNVAPTVPDFSAAGKIYVQDDTGRFVEADSQILKKDGVATLGLSTVFDPYVGMSYQDLTKLGANHKWCSIAAFKQFGLISQDAQAVFIVDDGYTDFDIDKTAFVYFKSSTHGLSTDDIGKIYFSESAFKKFKQILM